MSWCTGLGGYYVNFSLSYYPLVFSAGLLSLFSAACGCSSQQHIFGTDEASGYLFMCRDPWLHTLLLHVGCVHEEKYNTENCRTRLRVFFPRITLPLFIYIYRQVNR